MLGIPALASGNAEEQYCEGTLFIENDMLIPTDQNYTAGFVYAHFCNKISEERFSLIRLFKSDDYLKSDAYLGQAIYIGLTMYTPNDLEKNEPVEGDGRPYSSSAFVGVNEFVKYDPNTVIKHDLHFAVLGLNTGGKLQTWWHDVIGSEEPKGWDSQISDGGEPSFMYAVEGRGLLSNEKNHLFSVSGNLGASIGYYTSVKGGLAARFGKLVSPFWSDYGPAQRLTAPVYLHSNGPSTKEHNSTSLKGYIEYYLFIMGGMDFVIYNAMLQGQFRDSRYEISNSDISRMVPHSSVGIVLGSKLPGRLGIRRG